MSSTVHQEGAPEEFQLHDDSSPVEHGFVSSVPLPGNRMGVIWLDGRDWAAGIAPPCWGKGRLPRIAFWHVRWARR